MRIEDYALIGNLHTAALVGKNGSIDWLCLPRFDSEACFAALLGDDENGHWRICPTEEYQVSRRYWDDTQILETSFENTQGKAQLIDCMVRRLRNGDLVRTVEGIEGEVEFEMDLVMRFDYGSITPWVRYGENELTAIAGPNMIHLYTSLELAGTNKATKIKFKIRQGERIHFVLNWHPSHRSAPRRLKDVWGEVQKTAEWWKQWCGICTYSGRWKKELHRSLITLKSLTYDPTGGIIASPTTSLPEHFGGVRNWDYRYCWLRDATFTLQAMLGAGFREEAKCWHKWLLRAVAGMPSNLIPLYGLAGERRLLETELPWLSGYEGAVPVRVGNAASSQFQLDVYGQILDSFYLARTKGLEASEETWDLQCSLMSYLSRIWDQPDRGIWEVRGPQRHFTHSKLMAWVAFDRAVKAVENEGLCGELQVWKKLRAEIHDQICKEGFNPKKGSFTQYFGGDRLDASLLLMPLLGFLPAQDPRMRGTIEAIGRELMEDGFVRRYSEKSDDVDGLPAGEGHFLACSFWYIDGLVLLGRRQEAIELFEHMLKISNDVGLLPEEYNLKHKRFCGNFPQAFSHVGLINSLQILSNDHPMLDEQK